MNTVMLLEMAADAAGDRVALTTETRSWTYAQLRAAVQSAAGALACQGVPRLAYLGANSADMPVLLFAAGMAGIPFAPLNYRLTDAQLAEASARLAPVTVVVDETTQGRLSESASVRVATAGVLAGGSAAWPEYVDPAAVALLLLTSGTSGPPKVAVLRHRHLVPYVISTVEFMSAAEDEAILVSVPPYHIAGISSVLTSVYSGRRMVQLNAFTPHGWVHTAAAQRVTHAMVVPTMLGRILDVLDREHISLPSLRHLSYGGGRMPLVTVERTLRLLPGIDLVNAYGLTETSSTIALLGPDEHRAAFASADPAVRARLGSVGRPLPSIELEIRGADGTRLPAGQPGEIWVRGEQVSGEYVSHRTTDPDGWYPTRDRGYLDGGGYLFLDGRADDVIVRGGENISPGEIEDVLMSHPQVAEAAVIGLPDDEWGERVVAVVVSATDDPPRSAALQDWVRARLRSTRVPAEVHLAPALPATETGKILRRALRESLTRSQ